MKGGRAAAAAALAQVCKDHAAQKQAPVARSPSSRTQRVHDVEHKIVREFTGAEDEGMSYHVHEFAGKHIKYPVIEMSYRPPSLVANENMDDFVKLMQGLFAEIKIADELATIVPHNYRNDDSDQVIAKKPDIVNNFTKLRKWIVIQGGSWVFSPCAGKVNDVYVRFRIDAPPCCRAGGYHLV